MNKKMLGDYESMLIEKEDTIKRIGKLEEQLKACDANCRVRDCTTGGEGGTQRFKIEGFSRAEYSKKKTILLARKQRMEILEKKLENAINDVEEYINSIDSPRMRMILKLRYIDRMSWKEVAKTLGAGNSEDAVRKEHERFMKDRI